MIVLHQHAHVRNQPTMTASSTDRNGHSASRLLNLLTPAADSPNRSVAYPPIRAERTPVGK